MNNVIKQLMEENIIQSREHMRVVCKIDYKTKKWVFAGYTCSRCEKTLKTKYVATKHVCQTADVRRFVRDPVPNNVKTVSGKPYKKLDFIQN